MAIDPHVILSWSSIDVRLWMSNYILLKTLGLCTHPCPDFSRTSLVERESAAVCRSFYWSNDFYRIWIIFVNPNWERVFRPWLTKTHTLIHMIDTSPWHPQSITILSDFVMTDNMVVKSVVVCRLWQHTLPSIVINTLFQALMTRQVGNYSWTTPKL